MGPPVLWTPSPGRDLSQCSPPPTTPLPRSPRTLNGLLADKDALTAVLLRHVVPGAALKARDVPKGTTTVKTAGGEEIDVTRGRYITVKSSAGEAGVIAFDVLATNGVVHLVNSVF